MSVAPDGYVQLVDSLTGGLSFFGSVDDDLLLTLKTHYYVNCPDTSHEDSAMYAGRIRVRSNYYELDISGSELWCPPACSFDLVYELRMDY